VWFTSAERRWLGEGPPELAATLWAIKEAVYKAVGARRPFAPRAIEVLLHQRGGFVSRPACALAVWRTPQGETAVVAHTYRIAGGRTFLSGFQEGRHSCLPVTDRQECLSSRHERGDQA
jgi:phosphopantetheinyl transferase